MSLFEVVCADFAACFDVFLWPLQPLLPRIGHTTGPTGSSCRHQDKLLLQRRLRLEDVAQTDQVVGDHVQAKHPASESSGASVMPHL